MAAKHFYRQGFLLLLFNFISTAALEKRFSDLKRCADSECSMLLCRGKAMKDFSGPDCRFLQIKKSETIYVYYKLAGRQSDLWAGSVGSSFGYFPKDLLEVNHRYTEEELEVPAQETDFVCFDTGFDQFNNYDVDLLLGSPVEQSDNENKGTTDQIQEAKDTQKETMPSEEGTDSAKETEHQDNSNDIVEVPDDENALLPDNDITELPSAEVAKSDTAPALGVIDSIEEIEQNTTGESFVSEKIETKDSPTTSEVDSVLKVEMKSKTESVSASEGVQIPEQKTTFGTTFDAVISDEEITKKVTPYVEESEDVGKPPANIDVTKDTPLLSFTEDAVNSPISDPINQHEAPSVTNDDKQHPAEKSAWTSLGDTVFSVVSGGERTETEVSSEEEDDEEELATKSPQNIEEAKSESEPPLKTSENVSISDGVQIPELKTTFGTTFDAVISDDEITKNVTPYDVEESEDVNHHEDNDVKDTLLLSFTKDAVNLPTSDPINQHEAPPAARDDKQHTAEEKNAWTSFGDAVFSVVTGGERTEREVSSEEEDDEEEEPVKNELEESLKTSENESVSISEGVQIPELKTTFGTTFDAVISDDEITKKVTPYDVEESEDVEKSPEDSDVIKDTPLLSFTEDAVKSPTSDPLAQHEAPPVTHDDKPQTAEKNAWTSFGDAIFSVVTGGERTEGEVSSEEEDDEEKESPAETPQIFEEAKNELEEPPTTESPKDPENTDHVVQEPRESSSVKTENSETDTGSINHQTESSTKSKGQVFQKDTSASNEAEKSDFETTAESVDYKEEEGNEVLKDSELSDDNLFLQNNSIEMEHRQDLDSTLDEKKTVPDQVLVSTKAESHQHLSTVEKTQDDIVSDQKDEHIMPDLEKKKNIQDLSDKEPEVQGQSHTEEMERETDAQLEEDNMEEKEELLEDENALSVSQSDTDSDKTSPETNSLPTASTQLPEYTDSVMRLTMLRDHFTEEDMDRIQRLLGLKNLYKLEAMFSDLDIELQATFLSHADTVQEVENALEAILEASENTILDEIEKMLDSRNAKQGQDQHMDKSSLDEETQILDDFQELAYSLRQKYSLSSDSTPLATENDSDIDQDDVAVNVKEEITHTAEEDNVDSVPETESEDNVTVTDHVGRPAVTEEDHMVLSDVHSGPDVSVGEDGGHFNKNKDNLLGLSPPDEMQKVPQATLETPLDMGLGVEVEQSPTGSLDTLEQVSEIHEVDVGMFSTGVVYMGCILSTIRSKLEEWATVMISLLPEEWKPGDTLYGCPWQVVVTTAFVGVVTFTLFFWRTVLAVKKRQYLVDEKKVTEQIQTLKKEKDDALTKVSELQKQTEQLRESHKQSKETVSGTMKKLQDLESKVLKAQSLNEQITEEKNTYAKLLEEEQTNSKEYETRIEKLEKSNEKLQLGRKKIQEALAKTTILLDEAKIREDARNVQRKCLDKEYSALKEENKTLKTNIKGWEEKHKQLSEQIKSYQKSQKELEDSVVLKDHNVEVLSELLADLDTCDLQKGDSKFLANGEIAPDKKTFVKNRIKQMMDVSRVQTTLAVVEEERDRFMTKLLNEEKTRKTLEEKHEDLEHAIATLKSEKSHVENQFKILQQKNEIMVEMYQQKENALQQKLTKEELERRSKENLLSEVGGKALEAEEQVKVLRQRINEMEEQMKKTEEVYKDQIKEQENKTHSNWVNARNAERALNQEKLESSKLREKLAVLTSQLNERRAPLFRPNSGQPGGLRQGDSYGPSPVSGGAPSPPLMIEGPRRPPSAPVGRRIDAYGPRPPSDPHGRYPENKPMSAMEIMGPRSSSPANLDGSTQAVEPQIKTETQAEASTESPDPGPGSFLASPIRDSPGPMVQGPPHGPGPHDPLLPPGPQGRLPPPGPYRPPRPSPYHLQPGPPPPHLPPPIHGPPLPVNGHPGMPLPGPVGGEFGPRPTNGHALNPRPGPGHVVDPRGPPPPHFRPPPPNHYGPMPPPHGVRGPIGPRPPVPPDMRFPGPHDYTGLPLDLPPGVPPHPSNPGDSYGEASLNALRNSAGAHSDPRQDVHVKQEAPPQDSARPAMVKP